VADGACVISGASQILTQKTEDQMCMWFVFILLLFISPQGETTCVMRMIVRQNQRHGITSGTPSMNNLAPERCFRAEDAPMGTAKHKFAQRYDLLEGRPRRPRDIAFAAATLQQGKPCACASHLTTVREISQKCGENGVCMWMPNVTL